MVCLNLIAYKDQFLKTQYYEPQSPVYPTIYWSQRF